MSDEPIESIESSSIDTTPQSDASQHPTEELIKTIGLDTLGEKPEGISVENLPMMTSNSVNDQINILQGKTLDVFPQPEKEKTGFFKGVALEVEDSGIGTAGKYITRKAISVLDPYIHPELQEQPDDWNAVTLNAVDNIPHKYWDYVFSAKSKREQDLRRMWAMDDAKAEEDEANSPFSAKLLGGGIGIAIDAWSFGRVTGLPLFSHTSLSSNYAANLFATVGLNSVRYGAYETAKQSMKNYTDYKEIMYSTAWAAMLDLPITAISTSPKSFSGMLKLSNSKNVFRAATDAVNFKVEIEPDGSLGKRVPGSSYSIGAMKRQDYSQFADNAIATDGTILSNSFLSNMLKISPQYRGLTNESPTINSMTNRLTPHNFITKNISEYAQPVTYMTRMDVANNRARLTKQVFSQAYKESMGAKVGVNQQQAMKGLEENINKGLRLSSQEWNDLAFSEYSSGGKGIDNAMRSALEFTEQEINEVFNDYKRANNSITDYISPTTQAKYASRHYNMIESDRDSFVSDVSGEWKRQDNVIKGLTSETDSLKEQIFKVEQDQLNNIGNPKENVERVNELKEKLKLANQALDDELRDNADHHILLNDLTHLTSGEVKELKQVRAELNKLKDNHKALLEEQKDILQNIRKAESSAKRAKTEKTRLKKNDDIVKLTRDLKGKEKEILDSTLEISREEKRLDSEAKSGNINKNLFFTKFDNEIIWKDPEKRPSLRKVYADDAERELAASDIFDTITSADFDNNAFNSSAMDKFTRGAVPNVTVSRSLSIPDKILIDGKYIHTNLSDMVNMYRTSLTKKAAIKELFPAGDFDEGLAGIKQSLKAERDELLEEARNRFSGSDAKKAINEIQKKYEKDSIFANKFWNAVVNPEKSGWLSQSVRNYTVGTKLGAVVFSYAPDMAGNVFQHGLGKVITANIRLLEDSIGVDALSDAERNSLRDVAAGNKQYATLRTNRLSDEVLGDIPPKSPFDNAVDMSEKFGHTMMTLSGANHAENHIRNVGVLISQSEVIRKLNSYVEGNISDKDLQALRMIGIEPKTWAKRIMAQVDEFGEGNKETGWGANHPEWQDLEAKRMFNFGITTLNRLSVTGSMPVQAPFFMNSTAAKPFTQFSTFAFNAFYNHIAPSMQYMSSERAQALMSFVVLGSLVGPLYRIASGRPAIENEKQFATDTIAYSGILGPFWDYAAKLDAAMQLNYISDEKRRFRGLSGELQGPFVGLASDTIKALNNLSRGKGTQRDFTNTVGLTGITNLWYLRRIMNEAASALGFPEKRTKPSKESKI